MTTFVPNRYVAGSDQRVVTGLRYLIAADTHNTGQRLYMEANPYSERVRPTKYDLTSPPGDARDWHWVLQEAKSGYYTIGAYTTRLGWLYMEANPYSERVRPTTYNPSASDAQDWQWTLDRRGNKKFTISANTGRRGWLYIEANPRSERVRPTSYSTTAPDASDWEWEFIPVQYKLNSVFEKLTYSSWQKGISKAQYEPLALPSELEIRHWTNKTSQPITKSFEIDYVETQSHIWTFKNSASWEAMHRLNVNMDFNLPVDVGELGLGMQAETTQIHRKENSTEFTVTRSTEVRKKESTTLTIAPFKKIKFTRRWINKKEAIIPFSGVGYFTANADRLKSDGRFENALVDGDAVISFLKLEGYNVEIRESKGTKVFLKIEGSFHVNLIREEIYMEEEDVEAGQRIEERIARPEVESHILQMITKMEEKRKRYLKKLAELRMKT